MLQQVNRMVGDAGCVRGSIHQGRGLGIISAMVGLVLESESEGSLECGAWNAPQVDFGEDSVDSR